MHSFFRKPPDRTALLLVYVPLLTSCAGSPSALSPASPSATDIANLWWTIFGIALVIYVIVAGLLFYALLRYRGKPGAPDPRPVFGHLPIEIGWTAVPALILLVVFILTVRTMYSAGPPPKEAATDALVVRVIGKQWWWEYQYPDLNITTANEIHVPAGRPVVLELESDNVIHSFWAPELGGKTDLVPGHVNTHWFKADRPGVYRGQCAEYCGLQHANMIFEVVAESSDQFDAWVKNEQAPAVTPPAGLAAEGMEDFLRSACIACHTVKGTRAQGKVGPDLTHFGSRRTIASGVLPNTPENLTRWLADPQAVKPGNLMPNLRLSQEDIDEIVAYLESLK